MRNDVFDGVDLREHCLRLRNHLFANCRHGNILHTALKQCDAQFFFEFFNRH